MRNSITTFIFTLALFFFHPAPGYSQTAQTKVNIGIAPPKQHSILDAKELIVADFEADTTLVEAGNPVQFTNTSLGYPTFFKWTIPGATPSVSYANHPLAIYHTPGIYSVTLYVSGTNGNDEITKENYIEVIEPISNLPPGWEYPTTLSQHTLILPFQINARIFDVPLDSGDYIGVFYFDDENKLKCGGAAAWNSDPTIAITAQGNSPLTAEKDGFTIGEVFNWKIFSIGEQAEFMATPTYSASAPNDFFLPYGLTILADLYAGIVYELEVADGWSGISSPVAPWKNTIDTLLAPNIQDIIYMKNGHGVFYPEQNINTILNWENTGYFAKLESPTTLIFKGYPIDNLTVSIGQGWNLLPVPVDCQTEIYSLLQDKLNNVDIITEIAGLKIFWPAHNITTLMSLKPGKSYLIKANTSFDLEFLPCGNK